MKNNPVIIEQMKLAHRERFNYREEKFWDAYKDKNRVEYHYPVRPCKFCGRTDFIFVNRIHADGATHIDAFCKNCYGYQGAVKSWKSHHKRRDDPERRKRIRLRDGNKCIICGSTKNICVHHIFPVWFSPELIENENNMITLCDECHKKIHESYDEYSKKFLGYK